jgi:peroxiredoxin
MTELGQLEAHHGEFDARGVRVVAASLDDLPESAHTQQQFAHLTVLSDREQSLARAAGVIGPQRSPTGGDAAAPTTVLIDRRGVARWVFRPERYLSRLSPQELLAAIDKHVAPAP